MPKKTTPDIEPVFINPDSKEPPVTHDMSIEQKLDLIVAYLHRMDRRDHWRTIGGFFHGLITLIPIIIFLLSAWYFLLHGTQIIQQITDMSVKSMAGYSQQGLMDQFNQYIGKPSTTK